MKLPEYGDIYHHFKGNDYFVIDVAEHTEDGNQLVIYRNKEGKVFARPLEMFLSKVDKVKYPDAKQEFRFELKKTAIMEKSRENIELPSDASLDCNIIHYDNKEVSASVEGILSFKDLKDIYERLHLPVKEPIIVCDEDDFAGNYNIDEDDKINIVGIGHNNMEGDGVVILIDTDY